MKLQNYGKGAAVFGAGALGLGALVLLGKGLASAFQNGKTKAEGADADAEGHRACGVVLNQVTGDKTKVVQAVWEIMGLDRDEAEAMVDSAPVVVTHDIETERAAEVREALTQAGAEAEIVECPMSQLHAELPWVKAVLTFLLVGDLSHLEAVKRKWVEWDSDLVRLGLSGEIMEELRGFWREMKELGLEKESSIATFHMEKILGTNSDYLSADSDEFQRYFALEQLLRLLPTADDYSKVQREIINWMALKNGMDRETMLRVCREIWTGANETPETIEWETECLAGRWDALVASREPAM